MRLRKILAFITALSVASSCYFVPAGAQSETIPLERYETSTLMNSESYSLNFSKTTGGYKVTGLTYTGTEMIDVVIPSVYEGEKVVSIGYGAFSDCTTIASFTIPDTVTKIDGWAFKGCDGLTEITIPDGVEIIEDSMLYNCDNLEKIILPDSVTYIGAWAFASCDNLTTVNIPESVEYIGEYAFYFSPRISSVEIPSGVTSIEPNTFAGCVNLNDIKIPDTVTSIGESAFYWCTNLETIDIPDSVTTIDSKAFYYCTNLSSVTVGDNISFIGDNAFYRCSSNLVVSGYINNYTKDVLDGMDITYIEKWNHPLDSIVVSPSVNLNAGSEFVISVSCSDCGEDIGHLFKWRSDDSDVASVTGDGCIYGWRGGKTVVRAECSDSDVTLNLIVDVTVNSVISGSASVVNSSNLKGTLTNNQLSDYNSTYGYVINSYLSENADGTLTRVEFYDDTVLVVKYTSDGSAILESKMLTPELDIFGGFFSGADYNFIVYGQANMDESDDVEVMRVVKYSKSWSRLGSYSVCGANTQTPFVAGSLRMTETGGELYIHTCHRMYASKNDGRNHQANMTFVINQADMTETDSFYNVMNYAQAGYSSHSFNQFIRTDGEYVYRVDHGDAYPRAVGITKCVVGESITKVKYILPIAIPGATGDNYTGVSVGGFEISDDTCIITGNSVPLDDTYGSVSQRNAFIVIADKELLTSEIKWLTNYDSDDNVSVLPPQIVKIGNNQFFVMWKEVSGSKETTYMVTIDSNGNTTSDIVSSNVILSDCQPILCSDGLVKWYTTNGSKSILYSVNPLALSSSSDSLFCAADEHSITAHSAKAPTCVQPGWNAYESCSKCAYTTYAEIPALGHNYETIGNNVICKNCGADSDIMYGDVNDDDKINSVDVLLMRKTIAGGWNVTINETAADVNCDGNINNLDVLLVRKHIAGGWGVVLGPQT